MGEWVKLTLYIFGTYHTVYVRAEKEKIFELKPMHNGKEPHFAWQPFVQAYLKQSQMREIIHGVGEEMAYREGLSATAQMVRKQEAEPGYVGPTNEQVYPKIKRR